MSLKALQDYTFYSKSSRYLEDKKRRETWNEATDRVMDMHLRRYPQLAEEIEFIRPLMKEKKVLGSQRALQFGGVPIEKKNARLFNCFHQNTQFITNFGVKSFCDFKDGELTTVLTHKGNWKNAIVRNYGQQDLYSVKIKRGLAKHEVICTKNHRWLLKNTLETTNLKINDQLMFAPNIFDTFDYDKAEPLQKLYWCYGYIFGDGTLVKENGEYKHSAVRLCGYQVKYAYRFEEHNFTSSSPASLKGDLMFYTGTYLKTTPNPEIDNPELIKAFVAGYLAADGENNRSKSCVSPYITIQATGQKYIDFIRKCFPIAGIYIISESDLTGQETNFGIREKPTIKFRITNGFGKTAASFTVEDIEFFGKDEVWCLEVEEDNSFVLPFGLPTGNCTAAYCDRIRFFQEAFWLLLCGCGTGFSVQKHHIAKLPSFSKKSGINRTYLVPDTIEGWADALGVLLASYFPHEEFQDWEGCNVTFDFSLIRAKGSPLSSGVGKAPGAEPLKISLIKIKELLDRCLELGQDRLRPIDAYDVMMHASDAVLSGGVRRSASLCMFSLDDEEMVRAKTGNWQEENPQRGRSNNSVVLLRNKVSKKEFHSLMDSIKEFGEPGCIWVDDLECLFNPCLEIALYGYDEKGNSGWQGCNLCEINGRKIKSKEDFKIVAKAAAILGTMQAGYTNFEYLGPVSEYIFHREALLGVSITGMMDNIEILFDPEIQREMAKFIIKINKEIAKKININPAARCTCVKPSGTTSCVLGTASGIHPHHAKRYFRRVQANQMEPLLDHFKKFNPTAVDKSVWSANGTDEIITFCIDVPIGAKTKNDLSAIDLLEYVKLTQQNWVAAGKDKPLCIQPWLNHNVSNTINVRENEWEAVEDFIYDNRMYFVGVSLLPASGDLDYPQAPMVNVLTDKEILNEYGEGALLASGLIVDGLASFNNNLWKACDIVLGLGGKPEEPIEPISDKTINLEEHRQWALNYVKWEAQMDWLRRVEQFAERYCGGDIRKCTRLMKHVNNWKLWLDLNREYKDVDYISLIEEENNVKLNETIACSGGKCELF